MMDSLTVAIGNQMYLAVACPPARSTLRDALAGPLNEMVGEIVGLKPLLITVVIGLVVALVIFGVFPAARQKIGGALGWIIGLSLLGAALIALTTQLVKTTC